MNPTTSTIKKRSVTVFVIICILFAAVTARLAYIQFSWGDELKAKAISQWTREIGIYPKRGTIYDSNGLVLAASVTRYSLQATPNDIKDPEAVSVLLSPILGMDASEIEQKISNTSQALVWVKRLLSDEQAQSIKDLAIAGLDLIDEPARVYPFNNMAAQVLGFVTKYADNDGHNGQDGIELYYNTILKGESGTVYRDTDNIGREIISGNEVIVEALDGDNIVLTIDSVLQSYLQEACETALTRRKADSVYGIAMNPNTGEVYAMVNIPDYDPNEPPRNLSVNDFQALTKNMLYQLNLEPGSTMKTFILAGALEEGLIKSDLSDTFYCPGYKVVNGVRIHCSHREGHGAQTTLTGFATSCNPVFMSIGEIMGKDLVYEYLDNFGFTEKSGLDVAGEEKGIMISKDKATLQDWLTMCFGQAVSVTPMQLMKAFNASINGGYMITPHLLKSITRDIENDDGTKTTKVVYNAEPNIEKQVISEKTSSIIRTALVSAVTNGSTYAVAVPGYSVGGKTGTAQTYTTSGSVSDNVYYASCSAYAPADDPQISVYIVSYNPKDSVYGSVCAAPYVGDFLEKALPYLGVEPTEELPKSLYVPDVRGLLVEDAVNTLAHLYFDVTIEGTGNVIAEQSIKPSTKVERYTSITLTLTDKEIESGLLPVPNIIGLSKVKANELLAMNGFRLESIGSGDIILDQSITPGLFVEKGTVITVYFEEKEPEEEYY